MKFNAQITKVETIPNAIAWLTGGDYLEVSCGKSLTFRVRDTGAARRTYTVGRMVSFRVSPGSRV